MAKAQPPEITTLTAAQLDALLAELRPQVPAAEYDPSVGTMLAIMRYGAGQPMYRMDKWQTHFGVPLPASTQWELIAAASATPARVYEALIGSGAQGRLLHHDDTSSTGSIPSSIW